MFRGGLFCRLCSQARVSSHRNNNNVQWPPNALGRTSAGGGGGGSPSSSYRRPPVTTNNNGGGRVECNKYFSVSQPNRLPLPPIAALVLRPVAKFVAMMLGIRIRRWWSKLSAREKRRFWYKVRTRRKQISAAVAAAVGLFGAYCAAHTEVDPITGQRRLILFTQRQMVELANSIAAEMLAGNSDRVFPPSHPQYKRATAIAMRVVDANKQYDRVPDRQWFMVVVDDPRINAMVLSNGMIIVFAGLLTSANDDQVGVILSHEISHCLLDHHAVRMSREHVIELLWLVPIAALWAVFPVPEAILAYVLGHYLKNVTMLLPYERHQETEADKFGLMLAANACLDVRQAPVFWRKMERWSDPKTEDTWWLSTHPSHGARVKYIEDLLPYALQLRQHNGCPPLDRGYRSRFSLF